MLGEIGQFVLIIASCCALFLSVPVFAGSYKDNSFLLKLWKPALVVTVFGLTISLLCLVYGFISNDFSLVYVANNSNSGLSLPYKISAVWASHEGSMLLWIWTIAVWTAFYAIFSRDIAKSKSRSMAVLLAVIGLISLFLIFTSNPFLRNLPLVPPEGKDLNPILQDIGMIFHPPMLFLGYAGAAVCFALGIGALLAGKFSDSNLKSLTTVSVLTWLFLTAGNILGSWWAYNELGWGGWWFWDPVENSSFIPWLLMTAQLHALVLLRFRQQLSRSVLLISLVSFALCLLGTFIVRSGIIQSVHAFASDPNRGTFLLIISLMIVIPALILFALKAAKFETPSEINRVGDIFIVLAVLILSAASFCILFGTLYPLIHQAIGKGSLSVGAPYFNSIFAPLVIVSALLIGIFQIRKCSLMLIASALTLSSLLATYFAFFTEPKSVVYTFSGVFACTWLISSTLLATFGKERKNYFALLAHLGIALSIIGVVGDTQYSSEAVVRMGPGQGRPLGDIIFVYDETRKVDNPSFYADEGVILVLDKDENELEKLTPQRQTFKNNGMQMTAAGISHGLVRDLYVSMGNKLSADEYLVRLTIRPFVSWIWIGGLFMLISVVFSPIFRTKANWPTRRN